MQYVYIYGALAGISISGPENRDVVDMRSGYVHRGALQSWPAISGCARLSIVIRPPPDTCRDCSTRRGRAAVSGDQAPDLHFLAAGVVPSVAPFTSADPSTECSAPPGQPRSRSCLSQLGPQAQGPPARASSQRLGPHLAGRRDDHTSLGSVLATALIPGRAPCRHE